MDAASNIKVGDYTADEFIRDWNKNVPVADLMTKYNIRHAKSVSRRASTLRKWGFDARVRKIGAKPENERDVMIAYIRGKSTIKGIWEEASKRNVTGSMLIRKVVEHIHRDNLWEAVLDGDK